MGTVLEALLAVAGAVLVLRRGPAAVAATRRVLRHVRVGVGTVVVPPPNRVAVGTAADLRRNPVAVVIRQDRQASPAAVGTVQGHPVPVLRRNPAAGTRQVQAVDSPGSVRTVRLNQRLRTVPRTLR